MNYVDLGKYPVTDEMDTELNGDKSRIERTFQPLNEVRADEQHPFLFGYGTKGLSWDDLLESERILIVSEAGMGKTYECLAQQAALRKKGRAAFYFDLALLADTPPRHLLKHNEVALFDEWLASPAALATFFLDSIDELQLTRKSFRAALMQLERAIAGQLGRAKIVITSRPVAFDRSLVKEILPIPEKPKSDAVVDGDSFAELVMNPPKQRGYTLFDAVEPPPAELFVGLIPLSDD